MPSSTWCQVLNDTPFYTMHIIMQYTLIARNTVGDLDVFVFVYFCVVDSIP